MKCRASSDLPLKSGGSYAQLIDHLTVPKGTGRLRLTPSPLRADANIARLASALCGLWSRHARAVA